MYIEKEWNAPNGAACTVHRIQMILIETNRIVATVNSYTAPEQTLIGWQDRVEVPEEAFSATPMTSVAEWLTGEGRYLEGGTIVSETAETPPAPEA